jgi:predicted RNA binding protein YcfA (HicA-like mRNA interferase family)
VVAPLPRNELIRRFRLFGFTGPFSGGKHQFMVKGRLKVRIPNPHVGDIHVSLIKEIIRQAGIDAKTWDEV